MTRIELDHLEIRLRNISLDRADSIAEGLGEKLLNELDRYLDDFRNLDPRGISLSFDQLDAGVVDGDAFGEDGVGGSGDVGSRDIQGSIAESIVGSIAAGVRDRRSRENNVTDSRRTRQQ